MSRDYPINVPISAQGEWSAKRQGNDADRAASHRRLGNILLGQLKQQMALGSVSYGHRIVQLPDGAVVRVMRNFGQNIMDIRLPPSRPPRTGDANPSWWKFETNYGVSLIYWYYAKSPFSSNPIPTDVIVRSVELSLEVSEWSSFQVYVYARNRTETINLWKVTNSSLATGVVFSIASAMPREAQFVLSSSGLSGNTASFIDVTATAESGRSYKLEMTVYINSIGGCS